MKYRICKICGSKVSEKYESKPGTPYYCPDCAEFKRAKETYGCETIQAKNPIVEGALDDSRDFKGFSFCDDWCSCCSSEVYNIPVNRVSLCPEFKEELFPCAVCGDGCDWSSEMLGCYRFQHSDDYMKRHKEKVS